jgi:hypothetical protein
MSELLREIRMSSKKGPNGCTRARDSGAYPQDILRRNIMNIAFKAARLAAALALGAPTVSFSTADQTQIQNAVNFYTSNMTGNFAVTIAVATTSSFMDTANYDYYYNSLVAHSSGDATDTAAIASLGGFSSNNPVTGSTQIALSPVLASFLGVGSLIFQPLSGCDNLTATACIQIGTNVLNATGSPAASLFGTFEHEFDEVLGTSSALPNGGGTSIVRVFYH